MTPSKIVKKVEGFYRVWGKRESLKKSLESICARKPEKENCYDHYRVDDLRNL